MLIILGGLPASGKTTVSKALARELQAVYIRVDSLEEVLSDADIPSENGEGYRLAYRVAADNLLLGSTVIADSVNAIPITRDAWRRVGTEAGVPVLEMEIICSDAAEHRQRVESRALGADGLGQVTWEDVLSRDYEPWGEAHVVIDTAGSAPQHSIEIALSFIGSRADD